MAKKIITTDSRAVDKYIASCPEIVQGKLKDIRSAIMEVVPDAPETTSYFEMPGYFYAGYGYNGMFWYNHNTDENQTLEAMCQFSHLPARMHGFILDNDTGKRYPESKYSVVHKRDLIGCRLVRIAGSDKRDYSKKNSRRNR